MMTCVSTVTWSARPTLLLVAGCAGIVIPSVCSCCESEKGRNDELFRFAILAFIPGLFRFRPSFYYISVRFLTKQRASSEAKGEWRMANIHASLQNTT
jgi:hypothetical protein